MDRLFSVVRPPCPIIVADNVVDYMARVGGVTVRDLPTLAPPLAEFWIEYRLAQPEFAAHIAWWFSATDHGENYEAQGSKYRWTLVGRAFFRRFGSTKLEMPVGVLVVGVDGDGAL